MIYLSPGMDLSEKELVLLNAIDDACSGCQFASEGRIRSTITDSRPYRCLLDGNDQINEAVFSAALDSLLKQCLIERTEIRGSIHYGLDDAKSSY